MRRRYFVTAFSRHGLPALGKRPFRPTTKHPSMTAHGAERPSPYPLARLIMYHKHPISARTHFLALGDGRVCAFEPLPTLAYVTDDRCRRSSLLVHPACLLAQAERCLGLAKGSLVLNREFQERVDACSNTLPVYLARFAMMDPPFAAAAGHGCRFILLTETQCLAAVELELLRRAYAVIME